MNSSTRKRQTQAQLATLGGAGQGPQKPVPNHTSLLFGHMPMRALGFVPGLGIQRPFPQETHNLWTINTQENNKPDIFTLEPLAVKISDLVQLFLQRKEMRTPRG